MLNATTKRDKDGNIIGVVGVGQDITDKRIADEALTEAKLNQKVAEENRLKSDFLLICLTNFVHLLIRLWAIHNL